MSKKKKNSKAKSKKKSKPSKAQPPASASDSQPAPESRPTPDGRNGSSNSHHSVPNKETNQFKFQIAIDAPNVGSSSAPPNPSNIAARPGYIPLGTEAAANERYHKSLSATHQESERKSGYKIENRPYQPILSASDFRSHHNRTKDDISMKGRDKRALASQRRARAASIRDEFGIYPDTAPLSVDPDIRDEDMPSAFYVRPKRDMEGDPTTWNFKPEIHHCSPQPSAESFKTHLQDSNGHFSGRLMTVDDLLFEGGEDETEHSDNDSDDGGPDKFGEFQEQLHTEDKEGVFGEQHNPTIDRLIPGPVCRNIPTYSKGAFSLSIGPRRNGSIDRLEEISTKSSSIFSRNGSRSSSATSAFSNSSGVSYDIIAEGTIAENQSPVLNRQKDLEQLITMRIRTLELEQELRLTKDDLNAKNLEASSLRTKYDKDFSMLRRANHNFLIELEMMEETCSEVDAHRRIVDGKYRVCVSQLETNRARKVALEKQVAEMLPELTKLRALTAKYEKQLEKANKKDVDKLASELTKSRDLTQKLQGQLVTAESQRASLDHKLRNCVAESDTLRAQKTVLAQKIEELSAEFGKAVNSVAELQREVASVEAERKSLEDQLREVPAPPSPGRLQTEAENNSALTAEIASQKSLHEKLQNRCERQEKKIETLDDQLRTAASERGTLKEELRNQVEKIKLLEHQLRTAQDQREDLGQKLETQSAVLRAYATSSNEKKGQLLAKNERLRHQLVELDGERETQDLEIRILEDELCYFGNLSQRLEEEVVSLKSARVSRISSSERKERQQHMSLRRQLEALDEERESQDLEIRFLKDELFDSEERCKELERQVADLNSSTTSKPTTLILKDSENTHSAPPKEQNSLCQELSHILERRCVDLRAENRELLEDASSLRCQLATAINVQNNLRAKLRDYADEEEVLSLKLRHMEGTTQVGIISDVVPKAAYDRLQESYQSLSKQYQDCEATVDELHDALQEAKYHQSEFKPELRIVKQDQFKSAVHQKVIEELQSKILELEKERESHAPFVRFAVDARLGFLESARVTTMNDTKAEMSGQNCETSINAKTASQCGNGQLDAALFSAGLVPIDYLDAAAAIFKELYSITPSRYGQWGPQAARVVDCQATLKSLLPSGRDRLSGEETAEYDRIVQELSEIYASLDDESFESSEHVEELVIKLEYMIGMIAARSGMKYFCAL